MSHHEFLTGFRGPAGDPGEQGPPGDPGPPGPSGAPGAGKHFKQRFVSPADVWLIAHGLDAYPTVTVVDPDGREVWADVFYLDLNALTITFAIPYAGEALLTA